MYSGHISDAHASRHACIPHPRTLYTLHFGIKKKDSPHSSTVKNNWALRKHVYPECCGENQEHASWDLRIWRTKVLSWCHRAGERRSNGGKSLRPTELPLQGEKLREVTLEGGGRRRERDQSI